MSDINLEQLSSLTRKMKSGDLASQGNFYELTHQAVYRLCFFLTKNQQSAHDLCHDSFIKAFTSINSLKDDSLVLAWLFRIVRNTFFDLQKRKKEEALNEGQENEMSLSYQAPEEWLIILSALEGFSEEDRTLLLLIDLEGLSYREAGIVLKLSEDSIRMKLHKIRQEFIKKYES